MRDQFSFVVFDNNSQRGGAISGRADSSSTYRTNVTNCKFTSNRETLSGTQLGGGALYNLGMYLVVYGSSFYNNSAYQGGAILHNSGVTIIYYPHLFVNNSATYNKTTNI